MSGMEEAPTPDALEMTELTAAEVPEALRQAPEMPEYVEYDLSPKRWLGGFRDERDGKIYVHAATQTLRRPKSPVELASRDTQTVDLHTVGQQCNREMGTQTAHVGAIVELSEAKDYVIRAHDHYVTADELDELRAEKAIIIQRFVRGWLARREYKAMRALAEQHEQQLMDLALEEQQRRADEAERELERRRNPKTAADFEILQTELESFRRTEEARIALLPQDEQLAARKALLDRETQILHVIERLRHNAAKDNREKAIDRALELMACPKVWLMSDGSICKVETPFTERASELRTLYEGLKAPLSLEERLDVLLHVKWTVKEFDCALTRDLVDLIDREADLINRGRPLKTMRQLRRRIAQLFLRFCETPEFNPEAARFQRVPVEFKVGTDTLPIIPFAESAPSFDASAYVDSPHDGELYETDTANPTVRS